MKVKPSVVLFTLLLCLGAAPAALWADETVSPYSKWTHGPPADPAFFPIAVWLQSPANAARYRQAGINIYVALWRGPTEEQLAELKQAGLRLICAQNAVARRHLDDPAIIGWMHGDEPDNAQEKAGGGYGPPIAPEKIVADYQRLRSADPSRPVMLNLGQGVAWDGYYGRGTRSNHPEDYPRYIEGSDIASFDIYPAVHDNAQVAGRLWFVAQGVERLVRWCGPNRIAWNCLECTRIANPARKPTPHEVRCEAWMSLVHGSRGLIYFVHQFKPNFREAALLDDAEMLEAVTALNGQITRLAPVLNSPPLENAASVISSEASTPVAFTVRRHQGKLYLFAVGMRGSATSATFTLKGFEGRKTVEAIDEGRSLSLLDGRFQDHFEPWQVHLYRVVMPDRQPPQD